MLDRLLRNALDGFTVIEDSTGSVGKILAKQMASYARAGGKKVSSSNMEAEERSGVRGPQTSPFSPASPYGEMPRRDLLGGGGGSQAMGRAQKYVFLESVNSDLVVLEGFSTFAFEKTDKEIVELIRQIVRQVKQKRSFILTYDKKLLSEKVDAYLRAMADSVIIVETELQSDRVTRMLYVPKMRDSRPIDRLIKVTIDEAGIQADTREFVG